MIVQDYSLMFEAQRGGYYVMLHGKIIGWVKSTYQGSEFIKNHKKENAF